MQIRKKVWLIMDKNHRMIAKGVPRNRYLIALTEDDKGERFLTYTSKARAEAGFKCSWFYSSAEVNRIFEEEYSYQCGYRKKDGSWQDKNFELTDCMEAVEADMIFEFK